MKNSKLNFAFCSLNFKLTLWLIISLALSLIFFRQFWSSLPTMLSPGWVFGQYHAAPWGVLALCLIFLRLKRKDVLEGLKVGKLEGSKVGKLEGLKVGRLEGSKVGRFQGWKNFINLQTFKPVLLGVAVVAAAVLMPSSQDYLVFQVLLASLGVFVILFGRGAKIPSILVAIYGFAISFPLAIQRFAENAYSQTAIVPVVGLMNILGYPLQNQGQWVHFTSSGGEPISVVITSGCAGPATMGVFIALFALMMLDMPVPPKKAVWLFLFGVVGTWFQSFIRLIILMLVGYHWGEAALWTAHSWTIYILFPLWYLLFAYIYFRQAGRLGGLKV